MIPESRRVHVIGGSAYCKIFTLSCVAFLAAACTPPPPASRLPRITTEVRHDPELQKQRYAVQPNTFPWMTSYTALLMHLVRMFYSKDIKDVRLFWITTGGHSSVAHLVRRTADSVIVAFDS